MPPAGIEPAHAVKNMHREPVGVPRPVAILDITVADDADVA
jgi:hypothetical protein